MGQLQCPQVRGAPNMHLVKSTSKAFLKTSQHPFAFKCLNRGHQQLFRVLKRHKMKVVISACSTSRGLMNRTSQMLACFNQTPTTHQRSWEFVLNVELRTRPHCVHWRRAGGAQCKHQELSSNYTKAAFPPSQTRENISKSPCCPRMTAVDMLASRFSARNIKNQTLFLEMVRFDLIATMRLEVTLEAHGAVLKQFSHNISLHLQDASKTTLDFFFLFCLADKSFSVLPDLAAAFDRLEKPSERHMQAQTQPAWRDSADKPGHPRKSTLENFP